MSRFSRTIVSGALAAGMGFAALPAAHAQDDVTPPAMDASGSASILDSLNTANEGLNGPVKVKRNAEGLTITYTNDTEEAHKCSGLVLPYDQVKAKGLDKQDGPSGISLLADLYDIVNQGNSAVLFYEKDEEGVKQPVSLSGEEAKGKAGKGTLGATAARALPATEPGDVRTWTATAPDKDAVAVILCDGSFGKGLVTYKGIEDSIFFNEVRDTLGPVGSVVDGSSENPSVAGSVTSAIPGLTALIEMLNTFVQNIQSFFANLFNGQTPGSSATGAEEEQPEAAPEAGDQ